MESPSDFKYDVFLSHSTKDKPTAKAIATRLKKDGLRVWFDAWEIRPGDSIPAKIEEGLEASRVLVLCMSAHAFGSDWASLEASTFRFRDPLNKERRFIPLRLDQTPIKGSLAQFLYISWLPSDQKKEYAKLLDACQSSAKPERPRRNIQHQRAATVLQLKLDAEVRANSYAFTRDGKRALSGCSDNTMRLWDVQTGRCLRSFKGHDDRVQGVVWSPDESHALSASQDGTIRLWDVTTGRCLRVFQGHKAEVYGVRWSPGGEHALSSSHDSTIRLWNLESGRCLRILRGHNQIVECVSWSGDSCHAASGSGDKTVRIWDTRSGRCLRVLEGHTRAIWGICWSNDNLRVLSGSSDETMRLWDVETGNCLRVFEGHSHAINSVVCSPDDRLALTSGTDEKTVRLWDLQSGRCLRVLERHNSWIQKSLAYSADGSIAHSGDATGTVLTWDLSEFSIARRAEKPVSTNTQTPKSCLLARVAQERPAFRKSWLEKNGKLVTRQLERGPRNGNCP